MPGTATILAVDDTVQVLTLLVRLLERAGYQVRSATSGEAAIASVATCPPDLILLDVHMDGIDGLEVCRRLKENPETQQIPIILLSGYADVKEWVDGLRMGAQDYITKPFQTEELLIRVKTHLTLRRAALSLDRQALVLRETNEKLQAEITERLHVEAELRQSLLEADRARKAMTAALKDNERTTSALRQSEEKFRTLFEASSDAIMTLEPPSWRFTAVNRATVALFRASSVADLLSRTPIDLSPTLQHDGQPSSAAVLAWAERALQDGQARFEWTNTRLDGEEFPAIVSLTRMDWGGKQFILATARDVSETKRLESELAHDRKLEAVGQLAAGIAHEINTPAQYVGDGLHFLQEAFEAYQKLLDLYQRIAAAVDTPTERDELLRRLGPLQQDVDYFYLQENVPSTFERCIDGIGRVATIVRAMKEFAHPDQREKAAADLNQTLKTVLAIARSEYKYVADVETDFGSLPPVLCHVGDLGQVFLNLIVNAAHAIGEVVGKQGGRGIIRITTRTDGNHVQIDISDTGCGVPPSIRQRVFDPFFTTKEVGKGSGQGLAISRSIVVGKHQGTLTFRTELAEGTTFTIRLPIDGLGGPADSAPPQHLG